MLKFRCPSCQTKLGVPDDYANRRVRCNKCGQPCIVPKPAPLTSAAPLTPQNIKTSVPAAAPAAALKPQPILQQVQQPSGQPDQLDFVEDSGLQIEEDRNAAILKQARLDKITKEKTKRAPAKTAKTPSAKTSRSAGSGSSFSLTDFIPDVLHFPLSVVLGILAMALVIGIWIITASSLHSPLSIFTLFIPLAAAFGIRLLAVNRTFMLGVLAAVLGVAGIGLGRVVVAKTVIIPLLHKTANDEILADLKTVLSNPKAQLPPSESAKSIARDGEYMTCIALIAAVDQDGADPAIARKLALDILRESNKTNFLEMISQAGTGSASLEASAKEEPELSDQESEVMNKAYEHLGQWDKDSPRLSAARKYYPALSALMNQCWLQRMIDDPQKAFNFAMFASLGLLDIAWLLAGLCGAFVIAAFDI